MDNLNIRIEFNFKPYKNIRFFWNKEFYNETDPNHIVILEVDVNVRKGLRLSKKQKSKILNYMKKHNTEVLVQENKFYTIAGNKLCEIKHSKLN